ncbi:MAG TPA: hypothetical protein PLE01_01930 [Syntrophothermus lipocalidus]|nr:hypothetical protein [Syntrophothermus lipocalidus]
MTILFSLKRNALAVVRAVSIRARLSYYIVRNREESGQRLSFGQTEQSSGGGCAVQGYYTIKEVARQLDRSEAEVIELINAHLIPNSLVRVDEGVLLGPAGARRLLQLVKAENERTRRSRWPQRTLARRWHPQQGERSRGEEAESCNDKPSEGKELPLTGEKKNGNEGCDSTNLESEQRMSKSWSEYPWPLSEWVRLTGKAPGRK